MKLLVVRMLVVTTNSSTLYASMAEVTGGTRRASRDIRWSTGDEGFNDFGGIE